MKTTVAQCNSVDIAEDEYERFLMSLQERFATSVSQYGCRLFTTDAENLFDLFLAALSIERRQHYTCHACRDFVTKYGGLVVIQESGLAIPALWNSDAVPVFFWDAVRTIEVLIAKASITGVFLSSEAVRGRPITEPWYHMAVIPPKELIFRRVSQTAGQAMAEKKEDYRTLCRGLAEFPVEAVNEAIAVLEADALYRSETCLGVAKWLRDLHERRAATKNKRFRENITWLAVASAPAGWCHVRSTMIGTLLEDIVAGLPFDTISRRFADKMHPLQYQRPQAPPTAGNIAQAEKIVAQLKAEGSLNRRYARLDEIKSIWLPTAKVQEEQKSAGTVFGHLRPKETSSRRNIRRVELPPVTVTWEKFLRTVLPTADEISFLVPAGLANFSALVAAAHAEAPPILQWDFDDERNPVSWYVYSGGSYATQWGLCPGTFHEVTAVCLQPSMWHATIRFEHHGESVFFLLKDAKDGRQPAPLGLFPSFLKSEFHSIRATIEAYSQQGFLDGVTEASACGIRLQKGQKWNHVFRVVSEGRETDYLLDRWD